MTAARGLAVAAAALLAGCGATAVSAPTAVPQATATSPSPVPPQGTATARATASASSAPTSREVSEPDRGTTVSLGTGGTLRVVLHSTYWQVDPASDPSVLGSDGEPTDAPDPPGRCVPGGGCGTVTASFHALRPGRAVVAAHRTSCGEALRCTGDAGSWSVTVVVSG